MDCFDQAQALEQWQRERAISAQLSRKCAEGPSLTRCEDCDDEIPTARQALGGVTRCVHCQEISEHRRR